MDDGFADEYLKERFSTITEKLEMDIQGDGNGVSHVVFTTLSATTIKPHVDPSKSFSRRSVPGTSSFTVNWMGDQRFSFH